MNATPTGRSRPISGSGTEADLSRDESLQPDAPHPPEAQASAKGLGCPCAVNRTSCRCPDRRTIGRSAGDDAEAEVGEGPNCIAVELVVARAALEDVITADNVAEQIGWPSHGVQPEIASSIANQNVHALTAPERLVANNPLGISEFTACDSFGSDNATEIAIQRVITLVAPQRVIAAQILSWHSHQR